MEERLRLEALEEMKNRRDPISMLTCYDYPSARCMDEAGIEIIFIGDSVGTNVLGYDSPREVGMEDMLHHTRAVRRGVKRALVMADMPYLSYETPEQALVNARRFEEAGADLIKLEGGREVAEIIRFLSENKIAVMAHIGHTPQTFTEGGRVVVGVTPEEAEAIYEDALALEAAGAVSVLLECVPARVTEVITKALKVPTIGIGCGAGCDGQVLVVNDLLGWNDFPFRFLKRYGDYYERSRTHFTEYLADVKSRRFPGDEHVFKIKPEVFDSFLSRTGQAGL